MRCDEVREALPGQLPRADGSTSLALRRHLSRCRECRLEAARYSSLMGSLAALSEQTVDPPPDLVGALLDIPSAVGRIESVRRHVVRNRNAYLGGIAVAALGAAGTAAWAARRHRLVTARA